MPVLDAVEHVQRSHQLSTRNTAIIAFLLSDALWFLAWHARRRTDAPDTSIYDLPPENPDKAEKPENAEKSKTAEKPHKPENAEKSQTAKEPQRRERQDR